jgi:hypothetical protein
VPSEISARGIEKGQDAKLKIGEDQAFEDLSAKYLGEIQVLAAALSRNQRCTRNEEEEGQDR